MPELPEVETVKRKLNKKLKNKKIMKIQILHNNVFEKQDIEKIKKQIKNQTIIDIKRRGKWLLFELSDYYLLSHLRMEGKYIYRNINDDISKHELVIFNIDNEFELRYKDTRKFGKMYLIKKEDINENKIIKNLGLEPWDKNLNTTYLRTKLKNKNKAIKGLLLDQSIIAGIGNIYADEILFLSKINPKRTPSTLTEKDLQNIIDNTKEVLSNAITSGGTTIRSYTSEEGVSGTFQNNLNVHQRKGQHCRICKSIIEKTIISQRGTYYCPKCQK